MINRNQCPVQDEFQSWIRKQSEMIVLVVQEGYTEGQAIELLNLWELHSLIRVLEAQEVR